MRKKWYIGAVPSVSDPSPTDRLRELVREKIRRSGMGERRFEEHYGLRRWTLRGFLDPERQQSPSLDRAAEIADALGLSLRLGAAPVRGMSEPQEPEDFSRRVALRGGFLPIPYHAASSRRGTGPVAFSRDWLAEAGHAPDALAFVAIEASALAPQVPAGSLALVDSAARRAGGPAPWCFREKGQDRLAYLGWTGAGLVITGAGGEPPRVLSKRAQGSVTLLGRVLWTGSVPQ